MTVRLNFLGSPHFERDGTPVELSAGKAIALLAYLAAHTRPQSRDRLLGLLWNESAEDAARKNLRNNLWTIRRALGDVLESHDERLSLSRSTWTDVQALAEAVEAGTAPNVEPPTAIAQLQMAASLYGGPLLDGLDLLDAPEYELWLTTERERLAQFNLRALAQLGEYYRQAERWSDLVGVARQALQHDNLQEPMHRLAMEGHARLGQRREALHQYDLLRATLASELGVEPLPETEALRAAILRSPEENHAPQGPARPVEIGPLPGTGLAPAPARASGRLRAAADATALSLAQRAPPYVGRHAERAVLDEELAAAGRGAVRVALITGEVGIGKSRLWREWSAGLAATPDRVILETRCLEATQALPLAPIAQLLRSETRLQRILGADSPVPRTWLAEVARLVPEIRPARDGSPAMRTGASESLAPAPPSPEEERRRLFEAFTQCLLALGARPLVLFLDDAHWADSATLSWLGYLVDRLSAGPGLLLALTYRSDEASPALVRLAANWGRQGLARRITLDRLSQEDAAALIAALHVNPFRAPLVQAQGAGNPYFLLELAGEPQSPALTAQATPTIQPSQEVPPVLAELIRVRLERLGGPARQVLQAAAVLEPDFDYLTLRRTSGRDEEETLDALDELLAANVLVEKGNTLDFAHPLVAAVVRSGLSGARRAFLYRRAAEALETTYSGRLQEIAGRLAADFALAGDAAQAAHYATMAAEQAWGLAAPAEALGFYRQALDLQPTPERRLGLGRTLSMLGDQAGARAAFEVALAGFAAAGDRLGAARTCLAMAGTYLASGQGDAVLHWAEQSLSYLDTHANPDADPQTHAESHFMLGAGRLRTGQDLAEAETQLNEAARLAGEKGLPAIAAHSRFELGTLLAQRGDLEGALAAYHASIALAQAAGDRWQEILGYNNAAYHALLAGDLDQAQADIAAGLALDDELALAPLRQYLYSTRGEIALAEQQWDEAESWFNRGRAEAERQGNREQSANYLAYLGLAARGRGDLDGALVLLEAARSATAGLVAPYAQAQIDLWLAELYEQRGERAAAVDALERAEAHLGSTGYGRLDAWAARLRARISRRARPEAPREI